MAELKLDAMSVASQLVDQVWAIRDTALHSHVGDMLSGRLRSVDRPPREKSATFERQGSVAVFRVSGVMVPHARWSDEVSTSNLTAALNLAARDEDVKAGVLLIDSPGGMALGQMELSAAAMLFADTKPLTAHISGCCCSAAYWLASQATEIFAGPRDDVGSIGVRSLIYDFSKFFAEAGVEAVSSATGPLKDLGVMGKEISDEQRDYLQSRVDYLFEDFKAAVMNGRGMNETQFATVADGRVWFGEQAQELGLIDGTQSMEQTFAGIESAITSSLTEKPVMADNATTEPAAPKAATTAELKKTFPKSTSDWREEQTEAGATLADAAVAYAQYQEQEAEKAKAEAAEAKAAAEKAEETAKSTESDNKSTRGVQTSGGSQSADSSSGEQTDYRTLAQEYMDKHKCRWSEACLAIKRRHPEAVGAFGGPPQKD